MESNHEDFLQAEGVGERLQDKNEAGSGAIGIGDDEASVVAAIFLLNRNGVEMSGVYFGDEQGNIGIHAVIARIADDGIAGASEILLGRTCDGRIERGEDEVAVE